MGEGDKAALRLAGVGQPRPGTTHDRINHMEQYLQYQFTYVNQYQHSLAQYVQVYNQAWTHMFRDYKQAWNVDISNWLIIPSFQPPPQPVPPPPHMAHDEDLQS